MQVPHDCGTVPDAKTTCGHSQGAGDFPVLLSVKSITSKVRAGPRTVDRRMAAPEAQLCNRKHPYRRVKEGYYGIGLGRTVYLLPPSVGIALPHHGRLAYSHAGDEQ